MGEVAQLFVAAARRSPMVERIAVQAIANRGFEGCVHGRPGSRRQVLLVEGEMLRELGLSAGVVRENITTEGIRLGELESGRRLRIGGAVLEVTVPCEPCDKMDAIRPGLQDELQGRRGTLCRVIENGLIRRGDALDVIELAAARNEESKGGA